MRVFRVYVLSTGANVASLHVVDRCVMRVYVLLTYLQHYRTDVKVKMRVRMRDSKAVNLSAVWQGSEFDCCVAGLRI